MKSLNTAAVLAIGVASLWPASPAQANQFHPNLREERFLRSLGVSVDSSTSYFDASGRHISFAHFKEQVDKGTSFKLANQRMSGGGIVMKLSESAASSG